MARESYIVVTPPPKIWECQTLKKPQGISSPLGMVKVKKEKMVSKMITEEHGFENLPHLSVELSHP